MKAFAVRNLWKEYDGQMVLERVNLTLTGNEFVTIVGASGCGKTTFLKILMGDERPTRGELLLDGAPLPGEPGPERGVVFQRYSVFPHLSVLENVMLGLELQAAPLTGRLFGTARAEARARAEQGLAEVGLSAARDKYPRQLSGGMQQRLAIAQAVITRPRVLLLDEPFGALDPGIRRDMHELILGLWREGDMGVFLITHDLREGFALGTRLLVFDKVRHDPQAPEAYGATITFDIPLDRRPSSALIDAVCHAARPAAAPS
jgi:NitT/TauT family transport system ATP-binding protein